MPLSRDTATGLARSQPRFPASETISAILAELPAGEGLGTLPPLPPLDAALARIAAIFPVDAILGEEGQDRVRPYYAASALGYRLVHSRDGSMHLSLGSDARFRPGDFLAQARALEAVIRATGARRVLELGAGQGFNLLHLARRFPDVQFVGVDLMPGHVTLASRRAAGLSNLSFRCASFDDLPPDPEGFDLVFAVEALCHARDPAAVARGIAGVLAPGGHLILFDALRAAAPAAMAPAMLQAVRLYEAVTAVADGFRQEHELIAAYERGGLRLVALHDLTPGVVAGVRRLYRHGHRYFTNVGWRLATWLLPGRLRRNAIGALLGPYLVEGPTPGTGPLAGHGLRYVAAAFTRPADTGMDTVLDTGQRTGI